MTEYTTKDSGEHAQYASGMRRDTEAGKPRFDLILTELQPYSEQMLTRYAALLARGAEKYDARNWEDGDSEAELARAKSSLLRHTMQLLTGEDDEDHAAAVWFNAQQVEYLRWRIKQKTESLSGLTLEVSLPSVSQEFIDLTFGGPASIHGAVAWDVRRASDVPAADLAKKRVDEWLKHYSIDFIKGDLGDSYTPIDVVEFAERLFKPGNSWTKTPQKSGVADLPSFD